MPVSWFSNRSQTLGRSGHPSGHGDEFAVEDEPGRHRHQLGQERRHIPAPPAANTELVAGTDDRPEPIPLQPG
jgi:hypothetical protein